MNWVSFKDKLPEIKGLILVRYIMQYGPNWSIPNMKENQWLMLRSFHDERLGDRRFWVNTNTCYHLNSAPSLDEIYTHEFLLKKDAEWVRLPQCPDELNNN